MFSELVHGTDTFRSSKEQYSTCVVLRLFVVQYLLQTEPLSFFGRVFLNKFIRAIIFFDELFFWIADS